MKKAIKRSKLTAKEVLAHLFNEIKTITKLGDYTISEAYRYVVKSFYDCPSDLYEHDSDFEIKQHYSFTEFSDFIFSAVTEPFPVIPQPIREQAYYYWFSDAKLKEPNIKLWKKLKKVLKDNYSEQACK